MKRRRKSSIPFPVALCAFVLASLYSASGQPSPTPLSNHSAAWDAARGQLVVFGGFNGPSPNDETWVWNGAWTRKNLANRPTARAYANMAYDEAPQQVVLFGGSRDGILGLNDTWVWDGIDWSQWFPANQPSPRFLHGMAYDASRQEIVLFGGYDSGSYFDDTWVWNGTNWLSRSPVASPSPRGVAQGMAYDRLNREVVLFGGGDFVGGFANDTWTWNGTDWTARTPATAPPNRYGHALAYDGVRNRITLFGGSALNDTWVWDGTFWSQQFPQQEPPARNGHTLTFVPSKESLVLFGGMDRPFGVTFGDTWLWDGTTWRERPDFSDDFEAPTLNSFWTVTAQSGSVRLSTNLALSGSRSAQFGSTQNTGQKNIRLSHVFSRCVFGRVSVWLYDTGADEPSGNEFGLLIENRALGQSARLFVLDHDLGQTDGGTHYYQVFGQGEA